ncbi:kinase-like domain-containing protein, partial [Rhexocercosporidium sp. MPI-PUGE-AT-0058]
LGRGGFGTVDEVVYRVTNQTYARKIIPFNPRVKHSAEVEILKQLHHLHIVNLAAFYPTSNQLWLLMSPVAEGNLASFLRDDGVSGVNSEIFWEWEGCLASAVRYLHQAGLIHGDIKPQNILVSSDLKVCLADFGSARANHFEEGHENQTKPSLPLTPKYIAPETSYYKVAGYTWSLRTAADIFSLGCVWAEM